MPVAGSVARACRIELAVTLDRKRRESFELRRLNALVFEHPAETLGRRRIELKGVSDDSLKVQGGGASLERMQNRDA